jgi:hypothetical protein
MLSRASESSLSRVVRSSLGSGVLLSFALAALVATSCSDEDDDGGAPPLGGAGGDLAGSSGASQDDDAGGSGGAGASSGSAGSAGAGGLGMTGDAGTPDDSDETASGETGIFIGATAAHNAIREQLSMSEGLNPPLPDLTWSDALAVVAQDWADTLTTEQCGSIGHRPNGRYGENIAARGSIGLSLEPMPPDDAVAGWADEIACWTYGRITGGNSNVQDGEQCDTQCTTDLSSTGCGHYTQLVWANTHQVGCGYSTCNDDDGYLIEVWVCNYDPPGNVIGQYPYQED